MHAGGIFHGDLSIGNVLVVREEQKWRFFFIGNERTKKFYRLHARLRLKNLVQINMFRYGINNTEPLYQHSASQLYRPPILPSFF